MAITISVISFESCYDKNLERPDEVWIALRPEIESIRACSLNLITITRVSFFIKIKLLLGTASNNQP